MAYKRFKNGSYQVQERLKKGFKTAHFQYKFNFYYVLVAKAQH